MFAVNHLEALQRLKQFQFAVVVVARQTVTDGIVERLRESDVPCYVLDTAALKPVDVSARNRIAVYDIDLVVPTLRALIAQRQKKTPTT